MVGAWDVDETTDEAEGDEGEEEDEEEDVEAASLWSAVLRSTWWSSSGTNA